jgi:hypothetical protein
MERKMESRMEGRWRGWDGGCGKKGGWRGFMEEGSGKCQV